MMTPGHKPLKMDVAEAGGANVVTIVGSVSTGDAGQLRELLEELAGKRIPVIVLDLGQMDFICSLGLGAIITGHLKCRHHQGQIRLVNPTEQVSDLLETTRLTKLFPVYETVDEALPTG